MSNALNTYGDYARLVFFLLADRASIESHTIFQPSRLARAGVSTEADSAAALAEIERLFDAAPSTPDGDRLDVLTTLVEAYEAQHYPIPEPDPVEAIRYYMESRGLSRSDLEPYIGSHAEGLR